MKKLILIPLLLLVSFNSIFAGTSEAFDSFYPGYYDGGESNYEYNYCHRSAARVLNHLEERGADLSEITVVIIQEVVGQKKLYPSYTRFDDGFAWHVVLFYNGKIYDQNIEYGENGHDLENYFGLLFGNVDLNDILVRTIPAPEFYSFFYYRGSSEMKDYLPNSFIDKFLRGKSYPQGPAKYLTWY